MDYKMSDAAPLYAALIVFLFVAALFLGIAVTLF